jgi:hypothetical protein
MGDLFRTPAADGAAPFSTPEDEAARGQINQASQAFDAQAKLDGFAPSAGSAAPITQGMPLEQGAKAGVGFSDQDPASVIPVEEEPVSAGPQAPYMDWAQALKVARDSAAQQGPIMTVGNARAKAELGVLNEKNAALMRGQGDRIAALGEQQAANHELVADRMVKADAAVDQVNAEQQKADAADHARTEKYLAEAESGRKEYQEAVKNFDPTRLMGNAGRRVAFTLATAMGALGAAFLKSGRNDVLGIINDALDRDMEQQRVQLAGKKDNLSMMDQQYARMRAASGDDTAARLTVKANVKEGLASYVGQQAERIKAQEDKAAALNMKDQLYMDADKDRKLALQITSKPSGKAPQTDAQILQTAQGLMKSQDAIRATEVSTHAAELKAAGKGQDAKTDATKNRQLKIRDQYQAASSVVNSLEELKKGLGSGEVGAAGLAFPNLTGNEKYEKIIQRIISDAARARGGPITRSDQEQEEMINNIKASWSNPATWSDGSMARRIDALLDLSKARQNGVLEGQDPTDRADLEKQLGIGRRKPTAEELRTKLGAK